MSPRHLRGKQAVYILTAGPTFKPQRPWDWPPEASRVVLHAKNLPMRSAIGFARTFNKAQLQRSQAGTWDRRWAIVARHIRGSWKPRHGSQPERSKGGAV